MDINYDHLSVPSLRALLTLHNHPLRLVVRHFESRGYTPQEIDRKYRKIFGVSYLPSPGVEPEPVNDSDYPDDGLPW